jgi:hypothetical protein
MTSKSCHLRNGGKYKFIVIFQRILCWMCGFVGSRPRDGLDPTRPTIQHPTFSGTISSSAIGNSVTNFSKSTLLFVEKTKPGTASRLCSRESFCWISSNYEAVKPSATVSVPRKNRKESKVYWANFVKRSRC